MVVNKKNEIALFQIVQNQWLRLQQLAPFDDAVINKHLRDMIAARDALANYLLYKANSAGPHE